MTISKSRVARSRGYCASVYRRLTTLAGEEAQVDWGAFGSIRIGRGVRPLSRFVMVLSYSRAIFALFTVDQTLESFLRGRFDRNSYSIPHIHARRPVTLLASPTIVRVITGTAEIARHARSYDTGQVIEQEAHVAGLIDATRQANPSSARDRLRAAVPTVATLLERLAARGESLRPDSRSHAARDRSRAPTSSPELSATKPSRD